MANTLKIGFPPELIANGIQYGYALPPPGFSHSGTGSFTMPLSALSYKETLETVGLSASGSATQQPLGTNLSGIASFGTNQPFLNICKAANVYTANSGWCAWQTPSVSNQTFEQYLPFDSNGYATSLTGSNGTTYSGISTLLNTGMATAPPGATSSYPPGTYRLKYIGKGKVVIGGDGSCTLSNSATNTYVTATFTSAGNTGPGGSGGMTLTVSNLTDSSDYVRDISVVWTGGTTAWTSLYDSGQVFTPYFLSAMQNFASFRFMDWATTNAELNTYYSLGSGTTINAGATSGNLSSAWALPSGQWSVLFINGDVRTVTATVGSTAISWSGGLSTAITGTSYGGYGFGRTLSVSMRGFNRRILPTSFSFGTNGGGCAVEVMVALCNQTGANNMHWNMPGAVSAADQASYFQLAMNGAGASAGYGGLNSGITLTAEFMNETWNSTFGPSVLACYSIGYGNMPSQIGNNNFSVNRQGMGIATALMASNALSTLGATTFARVIPCLGIQIGGGNTYNAGICLSTPNWTSGPASAHPIKAVCYAPYWGNNMSSADTATMLGVANPLDDFFATLYSKTGTAANGSHTYSSVYTGGWLTQADTDISTTHSYFSSNYPSLYNIAYEGGNNFFYTDSPGSGYANLVLQAERDPRMGTAYTNYLNYWASTVGAGINNINNLFNDIQSLNPNGCYGAAESSMQFASGGNPGYKWAAIQAYIG